MLQSLCTCQKSFADFFPTVQDALHGRNSFLSILICVKKCRFSKRTNLLSTFEGDSTISNLFLVSLSRLSSHTRLKSQFCPGQIFLTHSLGCPKMTTFWKFFNPLVVSAGFCPKTWYGAVAPFSILTP